MNNLLKLSASAYLTLLLCSCTTEQATQWWNNPKTQQGVSTVEAMVVTFAENAALIALQSYTNNGSVDFKQVGTSAILYTAASQLRTLQDTPLAVNPVATQTVLQQSGLTEAQSQVLSQQLFDNAVAAMHAGVSANKASELNAVGLDKAAATLATK